MRSTFCLGLLAALPAAASALLPPTGMGNGKRAALRAAPSRREMLSASGASLLALAALPLPAHASYALYQASYDSFGERKATGYVPVATSDRATLSAIQTDIQRKRPQSALKAKKAPQYCAGQTSAVSPMLENVCANIGVSKADQSNAMADSCACQHLPFPFDPHATPLARARAPEAHA